MDLISRGQKNRISRGFNFAKLVFSKISGFLKNSRGYNFANAVLKQILMKHLKIVKIVKERIKMIYCQSVSITSSELLFTNHLHHQKHQKDSYLHLLHFLVSLEKKVKTKSCINY